MNVNNSMILIENRIGKKDDIYNKKLNSNTSRQNISNYSFSKKLEKSEIFKINYIKPKNKKITSQNELLNDQEMNSLKYKKAIKLDKRTYFQYYLYLIKKQHIILFTFIISNNYNILI